MKVNPINNNQTSFGAIKFRNQKSQKRFLSELKKLPLKEFNKALNVIKNQEDNFIPIMIANHNGMNEFDKGLKLRATIADGIVDAQNSLTEFLEECAKWADYHKLQYNYWEAGRLYLCGNRNTHHILRKDPAVPSETTHADRSND